MFNGLLCSYDLSICEATETFTMYRDEYYLLVVVVVVGSVCSIHMGKHQCGLLYHAMRRGVPPSGVGPAT